MDDSKIFWKLSMYIAYSPMVVEIDDAAGGWDAKMTMVTEFVVIGNWPRLTQRPDLQISGNADT